MVNHSDEKQKEALAEEKLQQLKKGDLLSPGLSNIANLANVANVTNAANVTNTTNATNSAKASRSAGDGSGSASANKGSASSVTSENNAVSQVPENGIDNIDNNEVDSNSDTKQDDEVFTKDTSASDMEDMQLWQEYKATRKERIREKLIVKYAPFVKYVAGKIFVNLPSNIEFDDLVSYGILGLIDAIEKFDITRNIKFKTYAKTRIRGAIFDELRVLDWTPRSIRQKARKLEKAYAKLEGKLGRAAKDEEVAEYLGITVADLHNLFNETKKSLLLSLDELFYDDEEGASRLDFVEDKKSDNPQSKIEQSEIRDILAESINKLSERERLVVTLYYYEDLTSKEIGRILGVSDSRISQLHTKAILRLRGRLGQVKNVLMD